MSTPLARIVAGPTTAPTLILLHGITGSAVSQAEAIDHWVARGYRVIAADARGHGLSPRWTPQQLARAGEVLVDDVVELLEALSAAEARPRPVLIGHSMGAATAMVVAVRRPELVAGAVLLDPARYGSRTPQELRERVAARKRARAAELADLPGAVARALADPEMPAAEAIAGVWASQRVDPTLLDTGVVAPPVPWEEAMAALSVPTLLVTGDRPGSARVGPAGLDLLARIANPHVATALVPGAGHDVRRTRPEGFWAAVDPWLDRLLDRQDATA
ncbi:alpha/beta fold hydrolase [Actinomyces ruminis]|uniref:Alpha/beta hydrolase n=1 Tax=Actinomyces ruminis TaxID=1937003 RepID=A0ABX4MDY3_9ACTO|nr:alpha/beta fold hydrolase [Actinomyces ruminis]PHP53426.1 alpha/beta hydrolase [Actinomyces ruminis]